MKIQFGTATSTSHTMIAIALGCIVFAISGVNVFIQTFLGESEKLILHSRGLKLAPTSEMLYCDLPYDDCLCSVLLKKFNTSENCITYEHLVVSRLLPLFSFFLQVYLVHVLFSLRVDRPRVIIYTLWMISIFIFIGMTISIYWSSCYHAYITLVLFSTGGLLFYLSLHNILYIVKDKHSSSNHKEIIITYKSEKNNNKV
jgi:hypothetical protein